MSAAAAQNPSNVSHLPSPLPPFEGQVVEGVEIKISSLASIQLHDVHGAPLANKVISTDDRVRIVGEFRVSSVRHYINKDGALVREQTLKPERASLCPWDPSDADDDGVLRR